MFPRFEKSAFLVVILLFFAGFRGAAAQQTAANAPDQPPFRTWTGRSGQTIEAALAGSKEEKVSLRKKDGTTIAVSLNSLSDADQAYLRSAGEKPAENGKSHAAATATPKKPAAKKAPLWYLFTNKKTGKMFRGEVLDHKDSQGATFWLVRDEKGQQAWLRTSWFVISKVPDSDRPREADDATASDVAAASDEADSSGPAPDRSVVRIRPPETTSEPSAPSAAVKEVVATGVGIDDDKALQNAYSQAIEQAVGVLVDAETKVKNDQLIKDEVLTYSRGFVEKYDVVKQWQEDGLRHVTIKAVVFRDKLVQKLKSMDVPMKEVAGKITSLGFEHEAEKEERAAEMFRKALAEFDLTRLVKAEIVGEPEIVREGRSAKIRVKVRVSPDMKQWREFSPALRGILSAVASRRASPTIHVDNGAYGSCRIEGAFSEPGKELKNQLDGRGALVALLRNLNANRDQAQWEVFRVPEPIGETARAHPGSKCRLVCSLLDDQDRVVAHTAQSLEEMGFQAGFSHGSVYPLGEPWWIGPVWNRHGNVKALFSTEFVMTLTNEDLGKVAKTAVLLEEVGKDLSHTGKRRHGSAPRKKDRTTAPPSGRPE